MGAKQFTGGKVSNFSARIFKSMSNNENLVFSPASIYTGLSMAAIGSKGQTQEELQKLLDFETAQALSQQTKEIQSHLQVNSNGITTAIANKIYTGLKQVNQEYADIMTKDFHSGFENVDFKNSFEQVRQNINKHVSNVTNNKIQDLLNPGTLDEMTRMVLVNAIYFKGTWEKQFNKQSTYKQPFYLEYEEAGKDVEVDMMNIESKFEYYSSEEYQYVSIPYQGKQYRMEIVLPKMALEKFESSISNIDPFLEGRQKKQLVEKVKLGLPKFKVEGQSQELSDILKNLGVVQAFSDEADFSFMDPQRSIKLSKIIHKAVIEVNEEGAEASAATGVTMQTLSRKIGGDKSVSMICSHPFLFSITHEASQTQLFVGKITNPNKKQ